MICLKYLFGESAKLCICHCNTKSICVDARIVKVLTKKPAKDEEFEILSKFVIFHNDVFHQIYPHIRHLKVTTPKDKVVEKERKHIKKIQEARWKAAVAP